MPIKNFIVYFFFAEWLAGIMKGDGFIMMLIRITEPSKPRKNSVAFDGARTAMNIRQLCVKVGTHNGAEDALGSDIGQREQKVLSKSTEEQS